MEKLLVTTGLQQTWGEKEDIVFLGDWCKEYLFEEVWSLRRYETLVYHQKDRDKFKKDYEYLSLLHGKLIKSLSSFLNSYHNTNYSVEYWKIVVGPWLSIFIPSLWDRWENLRIAFENSEIDSTFIASSYAFQKDNYLESTNSLQDHKWNFCLYSDFLNFQYSDNCKFIPLLLDNSNMDIRKSSQVKNKLLSKIDTILSIIQRNYKVAFVNSYFDPRSLIKISFSLRQLPRGYYQFNREYPRTKLSSEKRNEKLDFDMTNRFEEYLSNKLITHLPTSYLEDFSSIKKMTDSFRENCKIIFTSNSHYSNDIFKIWCAKKVVNNESKLIISGHGGAIPSLMSAFQMHEEDVAHKKIVWHKPYNKKQFRLPPNKFLREKRINSKPIDAVTIIGLDLGLYSYGRQSGPNSSLILDDFNQKSTFINHVNDKINVKVYPYPHAGWNTKQRYIDNFNDDVILKGVSFNQAVYTSKVVVCTYPQTTFSEAIFSKKPVILLYVKEYWELRPEFDELIKILENAKIIFSDPAIAANHINEIYDNPLIWWNSELVIKARNNFCDYCLMPENNWISPWLEMFHKEMK